MAGHEVIRLGPGDAARWVALRREMLADTPWSFASSAADDAGLDPAVTTARFADDRQSTVAAVPRGDAGGALLSTATLIRERHVKMAHRAWVVAVYTTPRARGRGLARAVLGELIGVARGWGLGALCLSASAEAPDAIGLYRSLGFEAWGTEPDAMRVGGRSYDEVHMRLAL